jgi:hypothetical protein
MFDARYVFADVARRERDVQVAVEQAERERFAFRRAAHRFAARLAYGFGQPTGLAACFAAGCAVGARRSGADALIAATWKIGRLVGGRARISKRGMGAQELQRRDDQLRSPGQRDARRPWPRASGTRVAEPSA